MEKKLYLVTDKAGPFVAGARKPKDGKLWLTANQAEYELMLGTIELAPEKRPDEDKPAPKGGKA
ncbi:hypothetical protein BA190_09380 [Labrys sp. WJW]|uniref:hypothetical protein n=1 Tax=Labrys sp. WJW TaxID=1737983 RepID=UPI00082AC5B4|nr:hypothetical protein [Labrys sp. WJW]OCC05117.1 hypothetical protein BA190_09380 [Labrys sp. WJW]